MNWASPGLLVHLRVSHLQAPLFVNVLRRPKAMQKSSSPELEPLQHSSDVDAHFSLPFQESGRRILPHLPSCGPFRVWLPSRGFKPFYAPGSLFQLPTLMGFSLQSLSPFNRSKLGFPNLYPFVRFLRKPYRPSTDAPTVSSRLKSRPPFCIRKD